MDAVPDKTILSPRNATKHDLFQAGDVVGQYRVEKVLGQGGMGVVYLVQHLALKKHFALKALPTVLAQEGSFVARFKREAEILARLKHAHIVNVTDFGESLGRLYLILEYVDGGSIEEWFEKNRAAGGGGAPAAEVARFIGQILSGLEHAHQAGIVHRDLKPANILLEKSGEAKISDFGLARAVADEEYRRAGGTASPFGGDSVTTTGTMVGTVDFMSPEARNMRPSDLRSDIYAVGVMTYFLLTGKKPHGIAQMASKLVPGLDPKWDKFIGICLAEDPADRYQTAAAAMADMRLMGKSRGPQRSLIAAGLIFGLALAGGGYWQWEGRPNFLTPSVNERRVDSPTGSFKDEPVAASPRQAASPVAEGPALRRLVLGGLPAGAVVVHGDRSHSANAEGRVELSASAGPLFVQVSAPGYVDWTGEVAFDEGSTEATLPLIQMAPHPVRFTGLPADAQLEVDGRTVSGDPTGTAIVELRPGRLTFTVRAPRHETLEVTMNVLAGTDIVSVEMKRLPPPAEVLVALPEGGEIKFKWVPAGQFQLGSPADERGRQRTDLARATREITQGFYMAETEMSQRQHRMLTGRNPSISRALGDESRPVEQVAWRELTGPGGVLEKANEQVRRLELPYRVDLPTEVEWEYACRAGTGTAFNDGSGLTNERDDPALSALAYYFRGGSQDAPSTVAGFKPNAWGLYDMHGNVGEWTYGIRGVRDPVVRGGNWKVGPAHCRSASRIELTPETRPTDTIGYRLVLRLVEE